MTITEFLLARIAEDEEVARRASHQKVAGPSHGHWGSDSLLLRANGALERVDRLHIARHDPARVLAECEVKRRIVVRHTNCDDTSFGDPCDDLRDTASVYADHPDYDPNWRP